MSPYRSLLCIAYFSDLTATRFILATSEFLWAAMLLWPGQAFDNEFFTYFRFLPEEAWGLGLFVTGVIQSYILITGNYHTKCSTVFAGFNQALWWFMVILLLCAAPTTPAMLGSSIAVSIAATWVWIRSGIITGRRCTDG